MSIRANYDGGKYFNRIQSGSFEARCYAAGLCCQDGPMWLLNMANHLTRYVHKQVAPMCRVTHSFAYME